MNPIGNESETTIPATTGHILLVFLHRAVKGHKPPWRRNEGIFGMDADRGGCWKKTQWERGQIWVQPLQVNLNQKKQATYTFFDGWKVFVFFKIGYYTWQFLRL